MRTVSSPSSVFILYSAPKRASVSFIESVIVICVPSRINTLSGATCNLTYKSPGVPNGTASPIRGIRIISPAETPAGTVTRISSSRFKTPLPRHSAHGESGTDPCPRHSAHVLFEVKRPKNVERVSLISPFPLHEVHVCFLELGDAPNPPHATQGLIFERSTRRSTPKTLSLKDSSISMEISLPRRPPPPPLFPAKNSENTSPKSNSKPCPSKSREN